MSGTALGGSGYDAAHAIDRDPAGFVYVAGLTGSIDFPVLGGVQGSNVGVWDAFVTKFDPTLSSLVYSTYLGGSGTDVCRDTALASNGDVVVGGYTESSNFPTVAPLQAGNRGGASDGFLARLSADGASLVFSTYWGGNDDDRVYGIDVDPLGNVVVAGRASSTDFPLVQQILPCCGGFVSKVTGTGSSVVFSTYVNDCTIFALDVDAAGNSWVVGDSIFGTYPQKNSLQGWAGFYDAVVTGFDPVGTTLLFSSYLGGTSGDMAYGVVAEPNGKILVSGDTGSTDFPTAAPLQASQNGQGDMFLAEIDPVTPALTFSTYWGGSGWDYGGRCAVDSSGNAYLFGATTSSDYPVASAVQSRYGGGVDGGITKLDPSRTWVISSTFLGGLRDDAADDIVAGPGSMVFVAAGTDGADLPFPLAGQFDAIVLSFDATGARFQASPRFGTAPHTVQFSGPSMGPAPLTYAWDFGDGATSTATAPAHVYASDGIYQVTLAVTGPTGPEAYSDPKAVVVSPVVADGIVCGSTYGLPWAQGYDALGRRREDTVFIPYGYSGGGVNMGAGDIEPGLPGEILTGASGAISYGPQVKCFRPNATPVQKINFYAYGTLKYGVEVGAAEVDGDAPDEILTGPGPGPVFGPHVRGWNYDGVALTAIGNLSFYAYGTLKFGVHVNGGNLGGSTRQEILTAPGPGQVFGPHVRAFAFTPPVSALAKVSFYAFATLKYGARADGSDVEADGWDEILATPGPGPAFPSQIRGFNYDAANVIAIPWIDFIAVPGMYGGEVRGGELDGDGEGDIVASAGPDPTALASFRGYDASGSISLIPELDILVFGGVPYGLHTATEVFGY
ncbi:MAG: PKD domain-containing protein [Acidobacteriota bacterium]